MHPHPLTGEQLKADLEMAVARKQRLSYQLWDHEVRIDVVTSTCMYGFPSCVLLDFSYGSGVKAESWNSYEVEGDVFTKVAHYTAMYEWMATKITERATSVLPEKHPMGPATRYGDIERLFS